MHCGAIEMLWTIFGAFGRQYPRGGGRAVWQGGGEIYVVGPRDSTFYSVVSGGDLAAP